MAATTATTQHPSAMTPTSGCGTCASSSGTGPSCTSCSWTASEPGWSKTIFGWASPESSLGNTDISETAKSFELHMDCPGVDRAAIRVQVVDNTTLKVTGRRDPDAAADKSVTVRTERSYGDFSRTFRIPQGADPGHITANVTNGVLTVTIAKKPSVAAKHMVTNIHVQ
jgi:HSP20 family molecular chaperone IbpA